MFKHWEVSPGDVSAIAEASDITPNAYWQLESPALVVPLTCDTALTALLANREEQAALDLVSHLGVFLVAIDELEDVEDVEQLLAWDLGGLGSEDGNGIPDAAEVYLLQVVLENHSLNLADRGGVNSDVVYDIWVQNVTQAAIDLAAYWCAPRKLVHV